MEQHFILRVPDELRVKLETEITENGFPSAQLEITKEGKYLFKYDQTYQVNSTKLPCIIESFKSFDNKQFCKISDISTLLVVDGFASETDGLTPPMKFVKERRFRKRKECGDHEESIENRVRALLEKDALANETVVVWMNKDEKEDPELKAMIQEIEAGFEEVPLSQQQFEEPVEQKEEEKIKFELKHDAEENETDKKIKELEEAIKKAPNPILKKRFEQSLKAIIEERDSNLQDK